MEYHARHILTHWCLLSEDDNEALISLSTSINDFDKKQRMKRNSNAKLKLKDILVVWIKFVVLE